MRKLVLKHFDQQGFCPFRARFSRNFGGAPPKQRFYGEGWGHLPNKFGAKIEIIFLENSRAAPPNKGFMPRG